MRLRPASVAVACTFLLSACAMESLPPPTASLDNIQALRRGAYPKLNVGAFTAGPGAPTAMDRRIAVRAGSQAAPKSSNGSFARFLGDTLAAELTGAGKLDAASPFTVSGVITDAGVDSGVPLAHAKLAARFTLARDGVVVFTKEFRAQAEWKSSLIGAVAIPDAFNHYLALFPSLVGQLLADKDFKAPAIWRSER